MSEKQILVTRTSKDAWHTNCLTPTDPWGDVCIAKMSRNVSVGTPKSNVIRKEQSMNSVIRRTSLATAAVAMVSATVFAQQLIGPDAGAKARGEVTSSATYQRHAQDYSRMMFYSQQITPAAAPAVVDVTVHDPRFDLFGIWKICDIIVHDTDV